MTNKMQGYLSLLLVVGMMFVVVFGVVKINNTVEETPAATDTATGADGVYEGQSAGYGGPIVARVTIRSGAIENIEVTGNSETEGLGSVAIEKLPGKMLEEKTVEVDGVSGATISSNAIRKAVKAALASAGLDTDMAAFH